MPYRPPDGPEDYRDEEWLRSRYWDEGLSQPEIAELCDCTKETIRRWMDRHGIEVRDRSERVRKQWEGDEERRKEQSARMSEQRTIHPSFFFDSEGYAVAGGMIKFGNTQVRLNRLLATLTVGDIRELRGKHVHHELSPRKFKKAFGFAADLDYLDNIEVLSPEEHGRVTRAEG